MNTNTVIFIPEELLITTLDNCLLSSLSICMSGRYIKEYGHSIERTGINECILIYCMDGKGYLKKNNKIIQVNKGDIVFCDKYAPHGYGANNEDPWSILWVHFCGQFTDYFAAQLNLKGSCGVKSIGYQPKIVEYLENILQSLNIGNDFLNLIQSATYLQLALCYILQEKRFSQENGQPSITKLEKVIAYMKENIAANFSLDELAIVAGMSKYHFTRCFKKATDYSPSEYFYRLKIREACELLKNTEYSINEISTSLSYNNQYYFSKQFKEITGYPPSKFRNLINNRF